MPRKSKPQLALEAEMRELAILKEVQEEYAKKFLSLLEQASQYNFYIEVKSNLFEVSIYDEDWAEQRSFLFAMPNSEIFLKDSHKYYREQRSLEDLVERIKAKQEEEIRLRELKKAALAKLSDEEKAALSLL